MFIPPVVDMEQPLVFGHKHPYVGDEHPTVEEEEPTVVDERQHVGYDHRHVRGDELTGNRLEFPAALYI